MAEYALVSPMAGRGSRFAREGFDLPKPLLDLHGKPYFWWATESARRSAPIGEMVFVVLDEHVDAFGIDRRIAQYYPEAQVVRIPDVTSGAAETALIGLEALAGDQPVAINDCDHAFFCPALGDRLADFAAGHADGGLMCFRSGSPAYSYLRLGEGGEVVGTVEKQVVSPFAIAGCYLFSRRSLVSDLYRRYRNSCPYDELFISGLYNLLVEDGGHVLHAEAERHCSFGTPEELARVSPHAFGFFDAWQRG